MFAADTLPPSLTNFVGGACPAHNLKVTCAWVVGFLNVLVIRRMPARRIPGSLLLAASLSFESGVVYAQATCKQILGNQEKMKLIEEINLPKK